MQAWGREGARRRRFEPPWRCAQMCYLSELFPNLHSTQKTRTISVPGCAWFPLQPCFLAWISIRERLRSSLDWACRRSYSCLCSGWQFVFNVIWVSYTFSRAFCSWLNLVSVRKGGKWKTKRYWAHLLPSDWLCAFVLNGPCIRTMREGCTFGFACLFFPTEYTFFSLSFTLQKDVSLPPAPTQSNLRLKQTVILLCLYLWAHLFLAWLDTSCFEHLRCLFINHHLPLFSLWWASSFRVSPEMMWLEDCCLEFHPYGFLVGNFPNSLGDHGKKYSFTASAQNRRHYWSWWWPSRFLSE